MHTGSNSRTTASDPIGTPGRESNSIPGHHVSFSNVLDRISNDPLGNQGCSIEAQLVAPFSAVPAPEPLPEVTRVMRDGQFLGSGFLFGKLA